MASAEHAIKTVSVAKIVSPDCFGAATGVNYDNRTGNALSRNRGDRRVGLRLIDKRRHPRPPYGKNLR